MQLADGLSSVSGPLKILKFREVLTEDISDHKNIILVFESFERSLAEEISLLKSKGLNLLAYMDQFFTEIRELLLSLSRNGIKQKRTLKLEEFVQVGKDWKLHSLTGFSLDMGGSVCVREEWLEELRCEFRRIIG